jgi:hypothetical protein
LHSGESDPPATKPAPVKRKAKGDDQSLSDDDVAAWLAVGIGEAKSDADTAVVDLSATPSPEMPIVPTPKKTFRSTAEEAADIIRRHQEAARK